ncbi:Aqp8 [Symbiodinium natans]|uniref:Aqp8 protein n=1 Tax=Symbiodinium natans TaxID=878477 RepID=A0A812PGC3_9DINO|nr:Aqp8 [Symbiodinium natans]
MGSGRDTVDKDSVFANYKSVFSRQFAVSLAVEFVGVMFFQILGGTSAPKFAPFVNGFALAVWIYVAANISGGHLNPAVSFSTAVCGFYPLIHTLVYIALQIIGAIVGAWVSAGLVPGAGDLIHSGATGPGCFDRTTIHKDLTDEQVFGWECVMTFTLISCVYACGVAKPGHGSHTPFAVGLALLACAGSGGQYTGAALNPARVLGPMVIFHCGDDVAGLYIGGQFVAAMLAMSVFAFVSGLGPLNPWVAKRALSLSWPEAVYLWITGSPPSRLQKTGRENINDFKQQYAEFYASEGSDMPKSKIFDVERCFGIRKPVVADSQAPDVA